MNDFDDELVNPSIEKKDFFRHDYKVSQQIIALMLSDRSFLVQCLDLVQPDYFEDKVHATLCKMLFSHFKNHQQLPNKAYLRTEILEKFKNQDTVPLYLSELEIICASSLKGIYCFDYLMELIVKFAKEQSVKLAVAKTIKLINEKGKDPYSDIWQTWQKALSIDKGHDPGLDYFTDLDSRYERMDPNKMSNVRFTSGFSGIDQLLNNNGLGYGEMGCFLGLSGSGKSIALINSSVRNLMMNKKVCYISLEMNQDKIASRFDSMITQVDNKMLYQDRDIVKKVLRDFVKDDLEKTKLVIKHYPGGSADTNTIRAYLNQMALRGFTPDMVVVDYIGEMKDIRDIARHESRQELVRQLRGLASENNYFMLSAIQSNVKGKQDLDLNGAIDEDALADSFGQARPLDAIWSINRPNADSNLGFLYVVKHRDGTSKRKIYFETDFSCYTMKEISKEEYVNKQMAFKKQSANNVELKQIN